MMKIVNNISRRKYFIGVILLLITSYFLLDKVYVKERVYFYFKDTKHCREENDSKLYYVLCNDDKKLFFLKNEEGGVLIDKTKINNLNVLSLKEMFDKFYGEPLFNKSNDKEFYLLIDKGDYYEKKQVNLVLPIS